ncbi:MAG TPA: polyribonucleotide nucleotidyltransferase [Candidatus Dormibacteraeota bacterium]|nr:polyribonucleotide nucleotidyltransferase [Candidatus Dormibacteraeota bacterium]
MRGVVPVAGVTRKFDVAGQHVEMRTGWAPRASGAVTIRAGGTMVLCTAMVSHHSSPNYDYLPLHCDYEVRLYAMGKMPGDYPRNEGRPSKQAMLDSRTIDRGIRPLFPAGFRNEMQAVAIVLSIDPVVDPVILAINGTSAALYISEAPFQRPVAAVRMGLFDGRLTVNPPMVEMERSELDLVVVGTEDAIVMVEAAANEVSEDLIADALKLAHNDIRTICTQIDDLRAAVGKPKLDVGEPEHDRAMKFVVSEFVNSRLDRSIPQCDGVGIDHHIQALRQEMKTSLLERWPSSRMALDLLFEEVMKDRVRHQIIEEGVRLDGRGLKDIRPIEVQTGVLPRAHGSALFRRGQTETLTVLTVNTVIGPQPVAGIEESKRFMHHYNGPPFGFGETRSLRSPGGREIGHGALAERALLPVIPPIEDWPYAMHLVSEVLSQSGSSAMASVCGGTLALIEAGVPIRAPVAGIAMGLVTLAGDYAILTDPLTSEDFYGDMDFKIAGTAEGITAFQLDMKLEGLASAVLAEILEQAREARLFVLGKMRGAMPEARDGRLLL